MKTYRGTGTASRFIDNHVQNQVLHFELEAKDARDARTKALRRMRDEYPKAGGYTHVVALEEVAEGVEA